MSTQDLDDDLTDWSPPTEAEQKLMEARRERNNKISQIMGQYLLKGFKMLATGCPSCGCILMEDRSAKKYCIGCSEVDDGDTVKDNPAVNEIAARKTVLENQHRNSNNSRPNSFIESRASSNTPELNSTKPQSSTSNSNHEIAKPELSQRTTIKKERLEIGQSDLSTDVSNAVLVLQTKLRWATQLLRETQGINECKQIASLISETSTALLSLKKLRD